MKDDEIARITRRIEKAERRLAKGIDKRIESRGVVSEADIRDRLRMKLEGIQRKG